MVHPRLAVRGVEEHIRVASLAEVPVPERSNLTIQVRANPRHFGLGDASVRAEGLDDVIDLPGGHPMQVSLHHHREQGLIDPAAPLQQRRERPWRSLGIFKFRSPAVVVGTRGRDPFRRAVRSVLRSNGAAPMCAVASASMSC